MPVDFKPLTLTPINFSLTAGTSIPAPLDSPPRTPIKTQQSTTKLNSNQPSQSLSQATTTGVINGSSGNTQASNTSTTPTIVSPSRLDESKSISPPPLSPTSATSHTSENKSGGILKGVRRFLSIRSHNHNKLQKHSSSAENETSRPASPLSTSDAFSMASDSTNSPNSQTLKHRKSNGWFNSTSNRRKSGLVVVGRLDERIASSSSSPPPHSSIKTKSEPPPPSIPELQSLGLSSASIGGEDLFKNIGDNISISELEESAAIAAKRKEEFKLKETLAVPEKLQQQSQSQHSLTVDDTNKGSALAGKAPKLVSKIPNAMPASTTTTSIPPLIAATTTSSNTNVEPSKPSDERNMEPQTNLLQQAINQPLPDDDEEDNSALEDDDHKA